MNNNTKKMLEFFYEISSVPRNSGNEEKIADYLEEFARTRNLECYRDKYNNVLIKKFNEKAKDTIILQAHTDMVCVKLEDSEHNFDIDPITIVQEGDVIKAKDTSLGADDGIGMAMILFILDSADITNINLECLFTTQEETTFEGVANFDYSKITSKKLINLDGCEDDTIVVSCDGDYAIRYDKKVHFMQEDLPAYQLKISNLKGGNSGVEIEKNRVNAILLMTQILKKMSKYGEVYISSINGGTSEINIPTACESVICTKIDDIDLKINEILNNCDLQDEKAVINISKVKEENVFTLEISNNLIDGLLEFKENIITKKDNSIITFRNVGKITTDKYKIELETLLAGIDKENLENCVSRDNKILENYGFKATEIYSDTIWKEKENSTLKDKYIKAYYEQNRSFPKIKNSHGVLECSSFSKRIPDIDMISIGAIIEDFHTVNEKIYISSCEKTLAVLLQFIKNYN